MRSEEVRVEPNEQEEERGKRPWQTPELIATFTEDQLAQQQEALTFVGDWAELVWARG